MKGIAVVMAVMIAAPVAAQESRLASDWRREREHIAENCDGFNGKALADCAVTLMTDYPFHIAVGSLSPQNGFGFGLAFVERYTPNETWRINFSGDAVAATSKSWRSGVFATFIRTAVKLPTTSAGPAPAPAGNVIHDYPVFRLYAQHTVLNHLTDFGPDFDNPQPREFGEDHSIVGGSAVIPLPVGPLRALRPSVIGGLNGRFISIHDTADRDSFVELFEDVRLKPSLLRDHIRLNYGARWQQFLGEESQSFRRWSLDLRHDFPLYRSVGSTGPNDFNGPNECFISPSTNSCPPLTYSRKLSGTAGLRVLASSATPFDANGQVPFYLQPTLGGSDINNQQVLAAFDDYRFRAPHVIAIQASLEHSVWGPLGAYLTAERGKATQARGDLNFNDLLASYSAGLSLRAGGAPVMTASYGWGSGGSHFIWTMDTSLFGGAPRPPLH